VRPMFNASAGNRTRGWPNHMRSCDLEWQRPILPLNHQCLMRTNGNRNIYCEIKLSQGDCFENREGTKQKVESEASWNGELGSSMDSESARNTLLLVRSARETEMEAFAIRQQCSQEETRNHPKAQNSSQERQRNPETCTLPPKQGLITENPMRKVNKK
jgi:hypothetical protein